MRISNKPTVFIPYTGGVDVYHQTIQEVAEKEYEGFDLTESITDLDPRGDRPALSVMEGD